MQSYRMQFQRLMVVSRRRNIDKLRLDKIIRLILGEHSFKLMENIACFARAAQNYGLSDAELFQTVDLYEKMNLHQVVLCLFALGRKVTIDLVFGRQIFNVSLI